MGLCALLLYVTLPSRWIKRPQLPHVPSLNRTFITSCHSYHRSVPHPSTLGSSLQSSGPAAGAVRVKPATNRNTLWTSCSSGVTLKLIQRKRGSMELLEMFTLLDRSSSVHDDRLFLFCFCTALHQSAPKDVQLVSGGAETVSVRRETTETGAPTSFPTHN